MLNAKQTKHVTPRSSETLLHMLETLSDALFFIDGTETIVYANASAQTMLGAPIEALCGKNFWRGAPQLGSIALYQAVITTRQTQESTEVEYVSPVTQNWLHVQLAPTVGGLMLHFREKRAPKGEIHALVDALPQLVWIARPDGDVTYHNQRLIDYLAMTLEQLRGNGWMAAVHPDDRYQIRQAWQTSIQTGMPFQRDYRLRDGTSGAYRWFLVRGVPQCNVQGTILHWVGTCTDIDEQKQAEERVKASEENWRMLAETMPQLVWIGQLGGVKEYFNQRWFAYTHATPEQMWEAGWLQFLHPDDYERTMAFGRHAQEMGEPYEIENRFREGQTGTYRWFLSRAQPVRDETGQIVKWFGTCTDIEDQKQAEQKLKASEENWRVLAEALPQLVWTAHLNGRLAYVNQRFCTSLGVSPRNALDSEWSQFLHSDDEERVLALRRHAFATGTPYEFECRLKEGQTRAYRWFLARGLPVRDETGQIVKWVGTATDIDEQKRTEEALRQSQERAQALMESSIIGIVVVENDETLVEANDAFLQMTGYTREEVQNGALCMTTLIHQDDALRGQQAVRELAASQQVKPHETTYVCRDGSLLHVLMGGITLPHHPSQAIGFLLDNSARKELEQRKDDFISMASHELKTPLTALKMQAQLVRKRLEKQGLTVAAAALSRVEGPVKQLERLIAELLDVSKIQAGRLDYIQEAVDLKVLLQEVADTLQQMNPTHTIVVRGTAPRPLIGDPGRLEQVFTNLISNAIKYSPNAHTVEVDLSTSAETAVIRVRDHGLGIPREQRDKVFDRFYRVTDPRQKAIPGLGMGLYIVAEIVTRHGGTITVESEVGKGSTFTVTLPHKGDT